MKNKTYCFLISRIIICCTFFYFNGISQSVLVPNIEYTIDSKKLIGEWHRIDSSSDNIRFTEQGRFLSLSGAPFNDGFQFEKDTTGNINSASGFVHWPPVYCNLYFPSKDTLHVISYSSMYGRIADHLYVKATK